MPADTSLKRIFIVDDHPVFRLGIAGVIEDEPDFTVSGQAETVEEALETLETETPDLVLVDISLKGADGLEIVQRLNRRQPAVPCLVLSAHNEEHYAERSIRAGAMGFVMKSEDIQQVLDALRRVLAGEFYLSQRMMPRVMTRLRDREAGRGETPYDLLSDRELEVFQMLGQGLRTREIAERLGLSPKTIQVYREHIKQKMGLKDSVELYRSAFEWAQRGEPV